MRPAYPATMKYLLLKHYRGAPAALNDVPFERWAPGEFDAHVRYMDDFAEKLKASGEYVESHALAQDGVWVRFDGEGRPPVTDGPFAETKDLIAGWMAIDVDSHDRAVELAAELSAAPGAGGEPAGEWLELRPFMGQAPYPAPRAQRLTGCTECSGGGPVGPDDDGPDASGPARLTAE